jgi:hypothetical protein
MIVATLRRSQFGATIVAISIPTVGCCVAGKGSFGKGMNLFRAKETLTNMGKAEGGTGWSVDTEYDIGQSR